MPCSAGCWGGAVQCAHLCEISGAASPPELSVREAGGEMAHSFITPSVPPSAYTCTHALTRLRYGLLLRRLRASVKADTRNQYNC